ncbi:PGF-pre-PGF domain-containing protein [Methanosarcina sp. MSH10X1]|uniref:PGF-pre-PGF domain-containing protein n=1 Tax=Methanosarcina sp. MSH10X1 TaxID=2507075 RepID=UPI000FFC4872|nr:PGF-pre-PGF domain-containing protein [Methanosarcina sp. MSH10X1]RXA17232.1 PGF-pre-PGF domain-containing protein [Methanosarcina sp. MSH10X1]
MKKSLILLMVMLVFALACGIGAAKEISVNSTDSIQVAVNSADPGDVIIVRPGVYTENIRINKQDLVIRSESGDPSNTIINTNSTTGFSVAASNTTIRGFRIESAETGIYMVRCNSCTVANNHLSDNKIGITLNGSNYNNVSENRVNLNRQHGIQVLYSEGNRLLNNSVNSNERGINHLYSNKSKISGNNVSNNREHGMWISHSNDNTISGNTANETNRGIYLDSSTGNTVSENIVAFNNVSGFYECRACRRNLFFNNYASNDLNADINTADTTWNTTKTAGTNIVGGPYLGGNFWAKPRGNGFSQTATDGNKDGIADNVYTGDLENVTDYLPLAPYSSPQKPVMPVSDFSTNTTSGYTPLTVRFTNLSQNAVSLSWDFENDGNADSADRDPVHTYTTPGNYTVNLTAGNENGTNSKLATIIVLEQPVVVLPVADFSANPINGNAPLSVQFTDLSQNVSSRNWTFGDGAISTEQNPVHIYSTAGTYTVSLTATDANGTSQAKAATITVINPYNPDDDDKGRKHRSGGGGGGGSPEPARNVEIKELSQTHVASGKPVKFDFAKNATCIAYVSFDAKKTAGKTTTIAEQLKAKSTLTSNLSSGEVYKYFNLWVGNAGFVNEKNIENPVVCFKVEKPWLEDKDIDRNSIILNRYSDKKWSQLPVKPLKEDNKYMYFTAETPGFTHFAITGEAIEKDSGDEIEPENDTEELEYTGTTIADTEQKRNPEQETDKEETEGKITSIPGPGLLYTVVCILTVYLSKKK